MKARSLLTRVALGLVAAALAGCVVYPEPVAVAPGPVVVRPGPSYYYGPPPYRYYGPRHGW